MPCARTISFASAAVIAITFGHQFSYAVEKGARLRPQTVRSDHILMVPLDATVTPPIFSISWWSRVPPATDVNPPPYVFQAVERTDAISRPGVE
ncbi:hypothetical protein B5K05_13930 [Rhizobium phaseoli]|uniref:hypothetical protein n=1 Tax=Rhizobium phaseoli TaxID=396 RepID=UPI000372F989|nr:hypothetical protein [Rhizobium phaseoli]KKZ85551.1 hypothetical protein RPHASCH2410_CH21485 [Rhizobium phaseoli Ch24-10]RDJ10218.1 hypothetical protein B5K04_13905 [Rhizobium phaseoli]RDJ13595.1 hypothetical protein B5K05_13930 [Rhizobium phaseoli]